MLGPVILGFYNVAFRLIYLPIQQVNPILIQVAFPLFSKMQDDTPRLKKNYLKYINLITSINAPVLAGITAIAPILRFQLFKHYLYMFFFVPFLMQVAA